MKAIFINANDAKVEAIEIENNLEAFYKQIGCEYIEVITLLNGFLLIVDEEAKLRGVKAGFILSGYPVPILGSAILVRQGDNSDFTNCNLPTWLVEESVKFFIA